LGGFVKQGDGALTLTGAMTQAGDLAINGGRLLTRDGGRLSDAAAVRVGGAGHLDVGVADTVASLEVAPGGRATIGADLAATGGVSVNGGTIDGAATLTGPTYALTGATVSANLGGGALTSAGNTFLSGFVGAETITVSGGVLTLTEADILNHQAALTVLSNATLALLGGDQTVRTLDGAGVVELYGHRLNITGGGAFSGLFLGAGAVEVDTGVLTPSADIDAPDSPFTVNQSATAQINSGVNLNVQQVHVTGAMNVNGAVRAQLLNVGDGGVITVGGSGLLEMQESSTISGGLMLHAGATLTGPRFTVAGPNAWLGGNGAITGSVVLGAGATLRPGASPGITTFAGDLDLGAGSTTEIEIAGLGGAGVLPDGHDRIDVGGVVTIDPTASLSIVRDAFDPLFEPSLGDRFDIFNAPVGAINGVFGTVTTNFAQGVIVNLSTGEVVGTGATAGQPLSETLGATANERAMIRQFLVGSNGGVEQYRGGAVIANALQGRAASVAAASEAFRSASPEGYAGFVDYGLYATRFKLDTAMRAETRPMGGLGAFVAGDMMRIGSSQSDDGAGYTLRSGGAIFGVAAGFEQGSLRIFAGFDQGRVSTSRISSDATGWVVGLSGAFTPEGSLLTFSGGLAYGDSSHDGRRRTFSDVSRFDDVSTEAFVATGQVSYRAVETETFSLTPTVGFSVASGSASGFGERNPAAYEGLTVSGQSATRTALELGVGAEWRLAESTGLRADAQLAYDFSASARNVTARVADDPAVFTVRAEGLGALSASVGVGLDYAPTESTRIGLTGRLGVTENSAFSAGGSLQFELRF
ncbi:MAG: autotransporter domain-containing protein, partial [Rubrimonas sp.]